MSRRLGLGALAAGLGICLPLVSLLSPGSAGDPVLGLNAIPAAGGSAAWDSAMTVEQAQQAAFVDSLMLLLIVVLIVWLSTFSVALLTSVRRVLAARRNLLVHSAVGATRGDFRMGILADGLRAAAVVCLGSVAVAAVAVQILVRSSPESIEWASRYGIPLVLSSPFAIALLGVTAAGLVGAPLLVPLPTHPSVRGRGSVLRESWADLGWLLVVGQVAASVLIVVGALQVAAAASSVERAEADIPRGQDTLVLRAQLPPGAAPVDSWTAIRTASAGIQDVESVSISSPGASLGFGAGDGGGADCPWCSSGGLVVPVTSGRARHMVVDEAFFSTLGLGSSRMMEPGNVLINDDLARQWFQGGDSEGRRIWIAGVGPLMGEAHSVAGVVEIGRPAGLGSTHLPAPAVYIAFEEMPPLTADILVRTSGEVSHTESGDMLAARLREVVPGLELRSLGSLDRVAAEMAAQLRWFSAWIFVLAATALLSAVVGLGAAMIDRVRARTVEFGVRRAVGARRVHVIRGVLSDSASVVAVGGVCGAALGLTATRGLASVLGGVSPLPAEAMVAIVGVLGLAAISGATGASSRALDIDPIAALQE